MEMFGCERLRAVCEGDVVCCEAFLSCRQRGDYKDLADPELEEENVTVLFREMVES